MNRIGCQLFYSFDPASLSTHNPAWNTRFDRLTVLTVLANLMAMGYSFSPDGAFIVSGSDDETVKVWSVESGDCLFSGRHLDESWRAVFRNAANPPDEQFDDAHTIGMSGEGQNTDPRCYLSQQREGCLLVVVDGPRIHFLEPRPVA